MLLRWLAPNFATLPSSLVRTLPIAHSLATVKAVKVSEPDRFPADSTALAGNVFDWVDAVSRSKTRTLERDLEIALTIGYCERNRQGVQ